MKRKNTAVVAVEELSIDDVRHANHHHHHHRYNNRNNRNKNNNNNNNKQIKNRNLVDSNSNDIRPLQTLVVRITDNVGSRINASKVELANDIFSTDELSLKSGYAACSHNQLIIEQAINVTTTTTTDSDVDDGIITTATTTATGIIDVSIDITADGSNRLDVSSLATTKVEEILGLETKSLSNEFDLVMFCLVRTVLQ
jgi:hypothetical protein